VCGIAGYFGYETLGSERHRWCAALMRRRGPDDEGIVSRKTSSGKNLYLLHSRLSVIDLDRRARQPFERDGNLLCYNGEVYNYRELRERLSKGGSRFATKSDTEVLSELLGSQGMPAVGACEGMWAFAWFDGVKEELYLCRDRFGEKPLYILEDENGVYFGSEPKFIFALLGHTLPVNYSQVRRYLVNGYKSLYKGQDTFFEGLKEVAPGSYLSFEGGSARETLYWLPNFEAQDDSMSYSEAVLRTREALVRSVELRLRADVTIAFLLSGGVDSNALVSIARRELGYAVHAFTVTNTDKRYEERDLVTRTVSELGLQHHEILPKKEDFLIDLLNLVSYHDSPISTISYYSQWKLMESIQGEGYRVSVSGTGADELFSGYFDHHNAYLAVMKKKNPARYFEALHEWTSLVAPIVRNPFLKDPDYFVKQPHGRDHIFLDAGVFAGALTSKFAEPFVEEHYSRDLLRNRMANELRHEAVPVILHEDDLNAMFFSVENRSPYLDTALFGVAQTIPTRHLIRGGRAKAVLRDAVRGIAPAEVIDNPRKVGFNSPLSDYLDLSDGPSREFILRDSPIFDLVRREVVEEMLSADFLPNSRSKFLFSFLNAKLFMESYT